MFDSRQGPPLRASAASSSASPAGSRGPILTFASLDIVLPPLSDAVARPELVVVLTALQLNRKEDSHINQDLLGQIGRIAKSCAY